MRSAPVTTAPTLPDFKKRSEEHTSELQSQSNLVCRLLLEKKKKKRLNYSVNEAKTNKSASRIFQEANTYSRYQPNNQQTNPNNPLFACRLGANAVNNTRREHVQVGSK